MGGVVREVSGVRATLCTLIREMHSLVNTYQAGHIPGIYALYYRLVFNNNFVQKNKNKNKQAVGWIWPTGHSVSAPEVDSRITGE